MHSMERESQTTFFWVPSGFHSFIQEAVSTKNLLCAGY